MQVILFDDFFERNCYDYCLTVLNARVARNIMTAVSWSYALFKHPIRWMTRAMTIIDKPEADQADITAAPVVYVMRSNAKSDFAIL